MPQFIAIPVGQGDAFYLEREELSVLIDGGRSTLSFPSMFQVVTKTDGVDVVVCTHNDADHANGILGFLQAGLRCGEVWLPGRWLDTLPDVLKSFVEVFDQLRKEIADALGHSDVGTAESNLSTIEAYAEHVQGLEADGPASREGQSEKWLQVAEYGWPESYVQLLEQVEPWEDSLWHGVWGPEEWSFWRYSLRHRLGPAGAQLIWSAIDAAARIRVIAVEAFHRGIPVRWFEFDDMSPQGGESELQPLNSQEVARVRTPSGRLISRLALTVSNKESLVFWSPEAEKHPSVLFTADSDLSGIALRYQLGGAIVTAPHHGSEANSNAYQAVNTVTGRTDSRLTWVRSDGRYRSRPGSTYLGLSSRRLCTICRHPRGSSTRKQAVRLYSRSGAWIRHPESQVCSCQ